MSASDKLPQVEINSQPHLEKRRLDLEEEAENIRHGKLDEYEEKREALIEKTKERFDDYDEVPQKIRQKVASLDERISNLKRNHDKFLWLAHGSDVAEWPAEPFDETNVDTESEFNGWGESRFVLQELSGSMLGIITDTITESANFDMETGRAQNTPSFGKGQILAVYLSVLEAPSEAPDDPRDWPASLVQYVYEEVNKMNGEGDEDLGNSLQQAMS